MCKFFSFMTDGHTNRFYFDAEDRKNLKTNNPLNLSPDSHSSIATRFVLNEDKLNKYEYNPLTKEFKIDTFSAKIDDSALAQTWVEKLDFKTIVPELVIKPIVNPFTIEPPDRITEKELILLQEWDSIRDSVEASVKASVKTSVEDSVWDSVRDSVWDSVRDSIRASVKDSVWASVKDSVWAYISSFFTLSEWKCVKYEKGKNPFQSCINLWEMGLVPSYYRDTWRLHGKSGIMWEGKIKDIFFYLDELEKKKIKK